MSHSKPEKKSTWREAASLIIAAPRPPSNDVDQDDDCGYQLLMIKRAPRTALAVNHCVFPGGVVDTSADEHVAWLLYFKEFGISLQMLQALVLQHDRRAPIFEERKQDNLIWAREISLRITALRETFEEVGLLLCRTREQLGDWQQPMCSYAMNMPLLKWQQKRVHQNPFIFLELCRQLRVVPDLWALHEWSVWASPSRLRKRYEAAFFMTWLKEIGETSAEPTEVQSCIWHTPYKFLSLHEKEQIWLQSPQHYELSRLLGIKKFAALQSFTLHRNKLGCVLYWPVEFQCVDALVTIYPGDDFHESQIPKSNQLLRFDATAEEFRLLARKLHRSESVDDKKFKYYVNFSPPHGHLRPLNDEQKAPLDEDAKVATSA